MTGSTGRGVCRLGTPGTAEDRIRVAFPDNEEIMSAPDYERAGFEPPLDDLMSEQEYKHRLGDEAGSSDPY